MKRLFVMLCAVALVVGGSLSTAGAAEIDVLLQKLVGKGVLTPVEAQIVKDETKMDVARQIAQGRMDTMPSWIQTMKLKGDLRLRYQGEKQESYSSWRNRGRYRLRLGLEANPLSNLKVGARLATGDTYDSRSTNQTIEDNFSKKNVYIDLAYAEYSPISDFKLIAGKFESKDYLWTTTDLLWDGDINPEGDSAAYNHEIMDDTTAFFNIGSWIIDDINSHSSNNNGQHTDPFLHYVQAGVGMKADAFDSKLAAVYYGFNGIQGRQLDHAKNGNTVNGSNQLVYDYDALGGSAEIGFKKLLGGLPWGADDRIAFFGDYVKNVSRGVSQDTGWAAGVKFGQSKISEPGDWDMKYIYASLDKDAFPDAYPDSDRYSGKTNSQSHEVMWNYCWKKNVTFGLDYYQSNAKEGTKNKEHLVQADIGIKF